MQTEPSIRFDGSRANAILSLIILAPLAGASAFMAIEFALDGSLFGLTSVGTWLTGVGAIFCGYYSVRLFRMAWNPGWIEISATSVTLARLGHIDSWAWGNISGPTRIAAGRGGSIVGLRAYPSGENIRLVPSFFGTSFQEMFDIIDAAKQGKLISRDEWRAEETAKLSGVQRSLRSLRVVLPLWIVFWILVIGGTETLTAAWDIRDAHQRADLAERGILTKATVTDHRCGRGGNPKVQFSPEHGSMREECMREGYLPLFQYEHPPGSEIDIIYDPRDPTRDFYAPDGQLPQRDVTEIWPETLRTVLLMLALFIPPTLLAVCWNLRQHEHRAVSTVSGLAAQPWLQGKTLPLWFISYGLLVWAIWPTPKLYGMEERLAYVLGAYAILRLGYLALGVNFPGSGRGVHSLNSD